MAHIIIAGRPSSEETAECVILAENLKVNFPSLKFITVLKHYEEWEDYAEKVCNLFGFEKKTHPLVFYSSGIFIGNKENFFKLVNHNFKISVLSDDGQLLIDSQVIQTLVQQQIKQVNEDYFTRINGKQLNIKVKEKFLELHMNESNLLRYNTLDTAYSHDVIKDMLVFVKYSKKFYPRKGEYIHNKEILQEGVLEIEEEVVDQGKKSLESDDQTEQMVAVQEDEADVDGNPILKPETKKQIKEIKFNYYKNFEIPTYTFSKDKYEILADYGMKYKLIVNPFLTFYGETILYNDDYSSSDDSDSNDFFIIKDFGRLPSLRKLSYDPNIISLIESKFPPEKKTTSSMESNLVTEYISENDLYYMIKSLKDINGLAMVRILPKDYSDFKHLGSSKIKILQLPVKDLDYSDIPLHLKIEQTVRSLKRNKILDEHGKHTNNSNKKLDILLDNEEFTFYFDLKEHFVVEPYHSLGVKHMIKNYTWQEFYLNNLQKDLNLMLKELNINSQSGNGLIMLLTKSYLYVSPLTAPFYYDKDGSPLFAEPSYFAGIFNLPLLEAEWPQTAQNEYVKFDLAHILKKSTN